MTDEAGETQPPDALAGECVWQLQAAEQTVATAESLTAGLISSRLASIPGASNVLCGGLVAYATEIKTSVLGVPADLVERHGVVSAHCAEAMASRARVMFGCTWAVAATGVAGPAEQEGRPVGTVFVAVAGPDVVRVQNLSLSGSRQEVRQETADAALRLLLDLSRPGSTRDDDRSHDAM